VLRQPFRGRKTRRGSSPSHSPFPSHGKGTAKTFCTSSRPGRGAAGSARTSAGLALCLRRRAARPCWAGHRDAPERCRTLTSAGARGRARTQEPGGGRAPVGDLYRPPSDRGPKTGAPRGPIAGSGGAARRASEATAPPSPGPMQATRQRSPPFRVRVVTRRLGSRSLSGPQAASSVALGKRPRPCLRR
jgi:hypothetical protein